MRSLANGSRSRRADGRYCRVRERSDAGLFDVALVDLGVGMARHHHGGLLVHANAGQRRGVGAPGAVEVNGQRRRGLVVKLMSADAGGH